MDGGILQKKRMGGGASWPPQLSRLVDFFRVLIYKLFFPLTFFDLRSFSVFKVVLFGHILTFLATLDIQAPSIQLGMKFLNPKPLQIAS